MRGTVERYGSGWRYRVELARDPATGHRRFSTKGGFHTERDARRELIDVDGAGSGASGCQV